MGRPAFLDLGDLTAVAVGTPVDVSHLETLAFMVGGTFVATYDVEASFDGGTTFVPIPGLDGQTTPQLVDLGDLRCEQVRLNVTAFTSGTVSGKGSGTDEDRRG